jgi:hypothetical protein
MSKIIYLFESIEEENILWLKRKLNYLIENLSKLNAVGWSIEKKRNEEKLEEIVNNFEGNFFCVDAKLV